LPARYLPLSILRERNLDLDEFAFPHDGTTFPNPYFLRFASGHFVSDYPVGAALLVVPLYVPSALGPVGPRAPVVEDLEKLSAAVVVALSAVVLYLTFGRLPSPAAALGVTAVYALGTSSLSVSSQALWQHGASQLALAAALYCLVRGRHDTRWSAFAGFPLAFAVICRPTDLLVVLPLALYVVVRRRRHVWGFVLSGLPPLIFQLWYNATYFRNLARVQFGFTLGSMARDILAGAGDWTTPLGTGLSGILLSPGRGLLVYSPIFLLSFVGIALSWRRGGDRLLRYASAGVVLTILLYAKWAMWWGGSSYGPRLLADLAPVLALSLYPLTPWLRTSRALTAVFCLLAAWSIGAHAIGAFVDDRSWYSNGGADVDHYPARLWSWSDNQLVNPPRDFVTRLMIDARRLPTSRTAPELLAASYQTDAPPRLTVDCGKTVPMLVVATNTGRAAWLAHSRGETGVVNLGWRWHADGRPELPGEGRARLGAAVLPGQRHRFWTAMLAPREPGTYVLEVGLVDEGLTWFSAVGTPPVRVTVTVARVPPRPDASSALPDTPSVVLTTDRPRYRPGEIVHLTVKGGASDRSWLVDAYLVLEGPGGAMWFHDARRLVEPGPCGWVPLATAVSLRKGHVSVLIDIGTAGMAPGVYRWRLVLTEAGRSRVVADGETGFELGSGAE
jgi:dolichyl-phosphate-mannose-protein mannosyltransferase